MDIYEESLKLHKESRGKLAIVSKVPLNCAKDLSLAYSPGVAQPCIEINKNPENSYVYTNRGNQVAVITDGTAVLGLGDIGPEAAMPVMEGKALLLKQFAGIDGIPICLNTKDPQKIIETCKLLEPNFAAINLEDISAPRCVEIERTLISEMNIPVFHDDQHGTAIVVLAGLINALKLTKKKPNECKVIISGTGAAGSSIIKTLYKYGFTNILAFDYYGILKQSEYQNYDFLKQELLSYVNLNDLDISFKDAFKDADIFIGVSAGNIVSKEMIESMVEKNIVMALANPTPEISYDDAVSANAYIVCTGRSDYPNQVNNLLAFPGIFKGALMASSTKIDDNAKMAASVAIASIVNDDEVNTKYIIPSPFNELVCERVAKAVKESCINSGYSRK